MARVTIGLMRGGLRPRDSELSTTRSASKTDAARRGSRPPCSSTQDLMDDILEIAPEHANAERLGGRRLGEPAGHAWAEEVHPPHEDARRRALGDLRPVHGPTRRPPRAPAGYDLDPRAAQQLLGRIKTDVDRGQWRPPRRRWRARSRTVLLGVASYWWAAKRKQELAERSRECFEFSVLTGILESVWERGHVRRTGAPRRADARR